MWPQRQQPTRFPHPWESPGKNIVVGWHFLLQCMKAKSESEVTESCPTPSYPMDHSLPGSSVLGIFQARVLEWVAIAFSDWSPRKALLSLLAFLWNSAFKWVYLSFSPLPFTSLLFSAICKASSDSHFAFLHFFFLGMVLISASYTMSSSTLSDLIPWVYLSLPLYNGKGFDFSYNWMV